jgi:hypothetical protein
MNDNYLDQPMTNTVGQHSPLSTPSIEKKWARGSREPFELLRHVSPLTRAFEFQSSKLLLNYVKKSL